MKRAALLCLALALLLPQGAKAQLTMQMGNNWKLNFTGNVNAFLVFQDGDVDQAGPISGGLVTPEQASRIRTGLLPGEFGLGATGQEAGLDVGVFFGVYPQIQNASIHDNFGNGTQAGAQIDLRQIYLTVGGSWGQILAGRNLSLFNRQNILTDMTLFGTGPAGGQVGAGGTTLGRIGFGYIYPNFNAQITYSTPANKPAQLSIGLFDPDQVQGDVLYAGTKLPRVEAEVTWTGRFGAAAGGVDTDEAAGNKIMLWANGMVQKTDLTSLPTDGDNPSLTSAGIGGGAKVDISGLSLVGSGYYASAVGTTTFFGTFVPPAVTDATGDARGSYGFIGQGVYAFPDTKWSVGLSYGESDVQQTDVDEANGVNDIVKKNAAIVGSVWYQWTKSVKWVGEFTHDWAEAHSGAKMTANQGSVGIMLFF